MDLKRIGVGALLCVLMGVNGYAEGKAEKAATTKDAAVLRTELYRVTGKLGQMSQVLSKKSAEARKLRKELIELDVKREALRDELMKVLAEADPEFKKLQDKKLLLQKELLELNTPRKKKEKTAK